MAQSIDTEQEPHHKTTSSELRARQRIRLVTICHNHETMGQSDSQALGKRQALWTLADSFGAS